MDKSRLYLVLALIGAFLLYWLFVQGFIAASSVLPKL